jgi:putative acetyltransferase
MAVRVEEPADVAAIHAVNRAAFDSALEANLVDALRAQAAGAISLVVAEDRTIVGHIMFSPVRLAGAPGFRAMALAPMAVTPDRQRTGIGSALVRDGLAECRRRGVEAVFVVGHPDYYPRFGFRRALVSVIRVDLDVPDEALMAMTLDEARPLPAGRIRYAAPFGI